ncbi:MAG: pilus assembly protein [Alphaproteobacteria bacterium]|nr:pilus assembly protein [Alphaproteobacteria bacterium]
MTLVRNLHRRRGNAIVELALVLPVVVSAVAFVADIGTAAYHSMSLKSAVRAGIDYAVQHGDLAGVTATIAAAAQRDPASLSVAMTPFCGCAATTVTCGGTCPGNTAQQEYVTVSVSEAYTAMFSMNPLVDRDQNQTATLRAQATFRTK